VGKTKVCPNNSIADLSLVLKEVVIGDIRFLDSVYPGVVQVD
jgi:hypothetical protein